MHERCAELGLTLAVVTRHGKESHLWNPADQRHARTFCGREVIGFASDTDPSAATCRICVDRKTGLPEMSSRLRCEGQ